MQIKTLDLDHFRNYKTLHMNFSSGINILYGENGQGKTNILEAVYICGYGKSSRSVHEREVIRIGATESHIKAEFDVDGTNRRFDVHMRKNETKGLAINRIPIKKVRDLYGQINIVMFSPDDMEIIKRGPSVRRNYLNLELCQLDKIYVDDLINYTKIVKQRNELLKKLSEDTADRSLADTLDIWDLQLSEYGKKIITRRRSFLDELQDIIFDIHYELSGGKEKLKIQYDPSAHEDDLYENLLKAREKDQYYKNTSVGPHRDDIRFYVNDKDLKSFGSQGQQRTCVLSLKLAELAMIEKKKGEKPILLLDDVLSELDRNRQLELLKRIDGMQTLITCAGMDEFIEEKAGDVKKFHIHNETVTET